MPPRVRSQPPEVRSQPPRVRSQPPTLQRQPGLVQALDAAFTGPKPREVKTRGDDYAWLRFPWDGRTVEIRITGKPTGASVVADNKDLPDPALVEQRRAQWRAALEGLQSHLAG